MSRLLKQLKLLSAIEMNAISIYYLPINVWLYKHDESISGRMVYVISGFHAKIHANAGRM